MAQPLSANQLAYLASEFTQLGKALEQYEADHGTDPDVDLPALQQCISDIDDVADNLANKAVATMFNDTASAYASLTNVTEQANSTATSLAQERDQYSRIASIATAMVNLATSLGTGNVVAVFGAIANCAKAIGGH
jgi:hypothetical protein